MRDKTIEPLIPWYKCFTGQIESNPNGRGYLVTGRFKLLDEFTLEITELPIGKWTRDYKTFLEELATNNEIDDIKEYH